MQDKSAFAIIICSYNPERNIFQRLLTAVLNFDVTSPPHEVIIIDNNSSPALAQQDYIQSFLSQKSNSKILSENTPGLTAARIAGIKEANADWIVFFDDDNEPDINYLKGTDNLLKKNPEIGISGPGIITVEFLSKNKYTHEESVKKLFQERETKKDLIGNNLFEDDPNTFPHGTGMILNRKIAISYIEMVESKLFTANDRTNKSLSSAGDTQILYLAMKQGYKSGTSPNIMLNHLISSNKTKLRYMLRLIYSLESGHIKSYNEVFEKQPLECQTPDVKTIFKNLLPLRKVILMKKRLPLYFSVASSMGKAKAPFVTLEEKTNMILRVWEKLIGIK